MPDLIQIKQHLEEKKKQIKEEILALQQPDPTTIPPETTDIGSASWLADVYIGTATIREKLADSLQKITHSLNKINNGIYGKCDKCSGQIEHERLRVLPFASTCMLCI